VSSAEAYDVTSPPPRSRDATSRVVRLTRRLQIDGQPTKERGSSDLTGSG
jgi:hypothetical protein